MRCARESLGPQSGQPPQCFNRSFNPNNASLAVDTSTGPHRGRVYFAWSDGGSGTYDVFSMYSNDHGESWSQPLQLNDDGGTSEQFWPVVSVGPDGRVTVGWLDRRNASASNGLSDYYVTQSVDGAVSFGPNRRISDTSVTWCGVPANAAPNFGDYIDIESDDRSVFTVWSDARDGGPDVLFARHDDRQLARSGDPSVTLHARTVVDTGTPTDAPDLPLGSNPPPVAALRVSPNPWTAQSHLTIALDRALEARLTLYAADGRRIRDLETRHFEAGRSVVPLHTVDSGDRPLPAGAYFVRLEGPDVRTSAKFVVSR